MPEEKKPVNSTINEDGSHNIHSGGRFVKTSDGLSVNTNPEEIQKGIKKAAEQQKKKAAANQEKKALPSTTKQEGQ